MEIRTAYYIDRLREDSVSIAKQDFLVREESEQKLGELHRKAYFNSENGRTELSEEIPEPYVSAVLAVWGNTPTITEGGGDE